MGIATAAFALAILEGNTQPGVWFPEEVHKLVKHDFSDSLYIKLYKSNFKKFSCSLKELQLRLEKSYFNVLHKEHPTS